MSRDPGEWWYVPPHGLLHDFDDAVVDGSARAGAKRWLAGFNGRVGEPAQNVQLAWRSSTGARVAVGTFPPRVDAPREAHRFDAVWMLDSVQFHRPGPPSTPIVRGLEHLQLLSQDDARWVAWTLTIDDLHVPAFAATVEEATLAHAEDGSVVIVSVGVPLDQLRVRRVPTAAAGYLVDPWRPQTVATLDSEWDSFFQDHPDLKPT